MDLWLAFAVSCAAVTLFQLIVFSLINLAVPALSPLLFQVGFTLILFPIGFVQSEFLDHVSHTYTCMCILTLPICVCVCVRVSLCIVPCAAR